MLKEFSHFVDHDEEARTGCVAGDRFQPLDEDKGRLLDAAAANTAIDEIAGAMRDALLNWPARVSGLIAAELGADPHLVQTVLQQHITDLLTEASDRFDPPGLGGHFPHR